MAAPKSAVRKPRKKDKKNVVVGQAHIKSTFNNTIVTITDSDSPAMASATITLTNLGDKGVDAVFGVIYPPQVAIVGFGTLVERPWITEGQILPCPVVTASLSADHRVTDVALRRL